MTAYACRASRSARVPVISGTARAHARPGRGPGAFGVDGLRRERPSEISRTRSRCSPPGTSSSAWRQPPARDAAPGPGPAEVERAGPRGPHLPGPVQVGEAVGPEAGLRVEDDPDPGLPVDRLDPAEEDRGVRVAGVGERLPALDDLVTGHPPAAPDEGPLLVEPAPDERGVGGGDGVPAPAPDERGEDGVGVPPRGTHPAELPARPDEDTALAVGEDGVLAQDLGGEGAVPVDT